MTIAEYARHHSLSIMEVAALCGVTYPTAVRWLKGTQRPTYEKRLAIQTATNKAVKVEDWP